MNLLCCPRLPSHRQKNSSIQPTVKSPLTNLSRTPLERQVLEKHSTFKTVGTFSSASTAETYYNEAITAIDVKDLLREVQQLESQYSKMTRRRRFSHAVEQVVQFCHKFTPSVDVIAQCGGGYAQLVWGSLKALLTVCEIHALDVRSLRIGTDFLVLQVAETSIARFYLIRSAVTRIGDIVSISEQFEAAYVTEPRVKDTLKAVYGEIYDFLGHILKVVSQKGILDTYP